MNYAETISESITVKDVKNNYKIQGLTDSTPVCSSCYHPLQITHILYVGKPTKRVYLCTNDMCLNDSELEVDK